MGVAGYNAPTGEMNRCVSGSWLLVNKSNSISVGTGGIVGMNESEKDLSFLLNRAFVGRQLKQQNTSRFAGGIIGTQSNKTTSDWTIENCINYGTVYGYLSHYSGGIVGQWTNNGGTIENCYNYGNLQTTYETGWSVYPAVSWHSCIMRPPVRISISSAVRITAAFLAGRCLLLLGEQQEGQGLRERQCGHPLRQCYGL